jgi:hypothetical protein
MFEDAAHPRWDGGGTPNPAEVIHPNEGDGSELQASRHSLEVDAYLKMRICCSNALNNGIEGCDLSSKRLVC